MEKSDEVSKAQAYGTLAVAITLVIVILGIIFGSWFTINEFERGIVTTLGKFSRVATPGLGFKVPFFQGIVKWRTDSRALSPDKPLNSYTSDNQEIDITFTVLYHPDPQRIDFTWANAQDYRDRLFSIANDRLKAEMGQVKLEHFAANRGAVRDTIKATLARDALAQLGVAVTDFQFTDVEYTKAFRDAVNLASVQKAGVETQEWVRVQAEKKAQTAKIDATGKADAAREAAKGEADANLATATAEAQAIRMKGEATAKAMLAQAEALARNPVLVEMRKAEAWDGKLPVQMLPGVVPFMNFAAAVKP